MFQRHEDWQVEELYRQCIAQFHSPAHRLAFYAENRYTPLATLHHAKVGYHKAIYDEALELEEALQRLVPQVARRLIALGGLEIERQHGRFIYHYDSSRHDDVWVLSKEDTACSLACLSD